MGANDRAFELQDIYEQTDGRIFISGIQALVRLPIVQRRMDVAQGLSTAGLISGYRGSPLGAYDQQLWKAAKQLREHDVVFQPGLNEDLAATALWGAQMHRAYGPTKVDGVFGIWYGKGPGVDRTGDVFRSANVMGAALLGGVLAVSGDDHAAQSSMYPHHTDGIFQAVSMPVLQPATVAEVIEYGLAGIALSRYSGLWVGLKTIAEVVEAAAVIDVSTPQPFLTPPKNPGELSLNWDPTVIWPGQRYELERRLIELRIPAARAWVRLNRLDKLVVSAPRRCLGIVTVGKAHQDLMQACSDMGLRTEDLRELGISIYKVAMSWPLEIQGIVEFARGHRELLVVEEKRGTVEAQIKDALYHAESDARPIVTGKTDNQGRPLLPEASEFSPMLVAKALVSRLPEREDLRRRYERLQAQMQVLEPEAIAPRTPYFCSGCPHNTSTRTPEGSISGGGIGCHVMALMQPELKTDTFCQMGGEGIQWVGAQAFSKTEHIFQNLGDGTYQHSGLLAIRAALALKTNITYKILFNDAVAMTGGQPAEGANDPARITRQLSAEGVAEIALVSDNPSRWNGSADLANGVKVHHRDELDAVQRRLREVKGVSAIVYEQTCAAEKRRRKKKAKPPTNSSRVMINARVCEGCGDCSVQSNCISIEPLETEFGRKRTINQTSCNSDLSCLKGFCPSFIQIEGAQLSKPQGPNAQEEAELLQALPPVRPRVLREETFNVLLAGIGGTGVLTVGALLGVAALLDGKASNVLDFTGFAQKNGSVLSQVRISAKPSDILASRIGPGEADLLIGADMVVSAADDVARRLSSTRSAVVISTERVPTAAVVRNRDATQPIEPMLRRLEARAAVGNFHSVDAAALARALFGDSMTAHVLMLGYALQKGLLPLSLAALERAIDLNGVAPALNKRAVAWGRIAAANPAQVQGLIAAAGTQEATSRETLAELIAMNTNELKAYQNTSYAQRYTCLMNRVVAVEAEHIRGSEKLSTIVAKNAFKVLAYKDEYEVARLYTTKAFRSDVERRFEGGQISVWLAPPMLSKTDPHTGRPKKMRFGPWIFKGFKLLASMKVLRGTALDPFGRNLERAAERKLAKDYLELVERILSELTSENYHDACTLLDRVSEVRGFGPVKMAAIDRYYKTLKAAPTTISDKPARIIPIQAA